MTQDYKAYLAGPEWAQVKLDLYATRGAKCERCGRAKNIHVHHKHYGNIFSEEPGDLLLLCDRCHHKEHFTPKGKKIRKKPAQSLAQKVQAKKAKIRNRRKLREKQGKR